MAQASSSEVVTVGCKLPHGVVLRAFRPTTRHEPVMGGGTREVTIHEPTGETFQVHGNSHPQNAAPAHLMAGGFALTTGVPKKLWDDWVKANADADMVRNGLIFAHGETRSVEAQAREKEGVRSGLERLDPNNLPGGLKGRIEKATA